MFKRLLSHPGAIFAVVFAWKIVLFILSAQPVPANDSFYFDGPVVNLLLHGKYVNPSIALAMPISGTEVFSCYPPFYQLLLLPWMFVFGTSVLASIGFHLALFGCYLLTLLAIFRRLNLPGWAGFIGGLFLFGISFHDRPDTLGELLGMLAVYAWIRSWGAAAPAAAGSFAEERRTGSSSLPPVARAAAWTAAPARWLWAMVGFVFLTFCTSLQLGVVYSLLIGMGALGAAVLGRQKFPFIPLLILFLLEVGLLALVAFGFPHLWAGLLEAGRQAPSIGGWRVPRPFELLRILRTVPGVLGVIAYLPWLVGKHKKSVQAGCERLWLVTVMCLFAALGVLSGGMLYLADSVIWYASFLQPLLVGGALALTAALYPGRRLLRIQLPVFLSLAAVSSVRAIGMTTWGLVCAADVGYPTAIERVRQEIRSCPRGQTVAFSAAYLYEAARHDEIKWVHCNWLGRAEPHRPNAMRDALVKVKPAKLILSQLDYYYFYERSEEHTS